MSRAVIVPGTYHAVESTPIGLWKLIQAIPEGMIAAGNIIFLIMLSTGCFNIINKTGALESGVGIVLRKINASKTLSGSASLWIMTFVFSLLGVIVGPEIQVPFVPIAITIALGLGFDLMTGLAIIIGGGFFGFMGMVAGFAILIFVILVYLLSKIIIEKNAQSISMTKILGYSRGEIARLYILPTSIMVVLCVLISIPVTSYEIGIIWKAMMSGMMTGWLPYWVPKQAYIQMFGSGLVCYLVVAALELHRISRVPMDMALKNVE